MFGSGFRIALGPLKFLFRDSKWPKACKTTHRFADYYVDKALQWRQERVPQEKVQSTSEGRKDDGQHHILLHGMAEQTEDRIELRNQILQALMAAQETTSVLISNVFFLLAKHPNVWQRLRQEALSLEDDDIGVDTLQNLKYLRNVLNESESFNKCRLIEERLTWNGSLALRLYPVFPQMNRVSLTDTILPVGGGPDGNSPIYVPKGTMFDTSYYVLHHLQSVWGPALSFSIQTDGTSSNRDHRTFCLLALDSVLVAYVINHFIFFFCFFLFFFFWFCFFFFLTLSP